MLNSPDLELGILSGSKLLNKYVIDFKKKTNSSTNRLEAGLCLYGSDIDTTVTPIEATLAWLVAKSRRERKDFPGWEVILKQLKEGTKTKRVGLKLEKGNSADFHSLDLQLKPE